MPESEQVDGKIFKVLARFGIGRNHTLTRGDVEQLGLPEDALGREPTDVVPELKGDQLKRFIDHVHQFAGGSMTDVDTAEPAGDERALRTVAITDAIRRIVDAAYTMAYALPYLAEEITHQAGLIYRAADLGLTERQTADELAKLHEWMTDALEVGHKKKEAKPTPEAPTLDTGNPIA